MEKILRFLKKYIIPSFLFNLLHPIYHFSLSFLGALIYGFPSKKIKVIGVTGTKGKTTTCYLIAQILELSGFKTGMATTALFKIGEKEWVNKTKQTMIGRFGLQKLLKQMVKSHCIYAVIETSSEGILQYRHSFIDYDVAVFTNLSPEHIERHGSFENYRKAKIKLFEKVAQKKDGIGIYNLDDKNAGYFLKPKITQQYVYSQQISDARGQIKNLHLFSNIKQNFNNKKTQFLFNNEKMEIPLIGEFNVYNTIAAISTALSQDISLEKIKNILSKLKSPAGRMELIEKGQNFTIIIDYAHEPLSLESAYKTALSLKNQKNDNKNQKLICLLGAQGGGRDKNKRMTMGKLAAQYCDKIILTNEDPYDETPEKIINDIAIGVLESQEQNFNAKNLFKIIDRREAIKTALSLAKKDDIVILTGKGGEVWMCVENGKKTPWDEKEVVEQELIFLK
ncbi:UDP-N-acetylmuramyl-tripeptide synthetase [Candidatus Wolfebacteria bacterium]|nr:UDP-N-acetylmuramyl-tripeptide synthetase [Candidatus Wolfebacteria bacterium]